MSILERLSQKRWERKLRRQACGVPGCKDIICRQPEHEHTSCYRCKAPTTHKRIWIESDTLRRRMVSLCDSCNYFNPSPTQSKLRSERVRQDWEKVTVPINPSVINPERMEEQYPGIARQAIRAFLASDDEFATLEASLPAGQIQSAIDTLGLGDTLYAEQRDNTTVLRKIDR